MKKDMKMIAYMVAFVFLAVLIGFFMGSFFDISTANIAIINIDSQISPPGVVYGAVNPEDFKTLLNSAQTNPNIKAVILSINSPGGTVVSSQEIVSLVKKFEKPVVAWIRDIGTSGAYWVASAADKIVASPISMTGSIGVTQTYLEFSDLFDKYGIKYVNLSYPLKKDILTPYREITEQEREHIMSMLNTSYWYFVNDIAENRNMTFMQIVNASENGTVMLGEQAHEKDLVDYLGSYEKAVETAANLAGIEYPETEVLEQEDTLNNLLSLLYSRTGVNLRNDMIIRT